MPNTKQQVYCNSCLHVSWFFACLWHINRGVCFSTIKVYDCEIENVSSSFTKPVETGKIRIVIWYWNYKQPQCSEVNSGVFHNQSSLPVVCTVATWCAHLIGWALCSPPSSDDRGGLWLAERQFRAAQRVAGRFFLQAAGWMHLDIITVPSTPPCFTPVRHCIYCVTVHFTYTLY